MWMTLHSASRSSARIGNALSSIFIAASAILPMDKIHFLSMDPRVVVIPVTKEQAQQLGAKVYKTVADPYKFQEALILGADEGYYGECRFALDPGNRGYLKMDRSALGKFVGKFNPSRGDLVLSKSGDLIGIMVNKQYCALLISFHAESNDSRGLQPERARNRHSAFVNATGPAWIAP